MKIWKLQRLTALLLMPLLTWLVISLTQLEAYHYYELSQWIATTHVAWLLILTIITLAVHAYIGIEEVLTDYLTASQFAVAIKLLKITALLTLILSLTSIYLISGTF